MKLVKSFAAAAVVLTGTIAQADTEKTQINNYYTIKVGEHSTAYVFTNAAEGVTCSLTLEEDLVLSRALLVGGGGGGGGGNGGGGGAGGMLELEPGVLLSAGTTLGVKVGAGGAGGAAADPSVATPNNETLGEKGGDTTLTIGGTTYTAVGGGYGASRYAGSPSQPAHNLHNGGAGGSGGGAAFGQTGGAATAGQGNAGGSGGQPYNMLANGGGGAGAAGGAASASANTGNPLYIVGGAGGDGKMSDITGNEVWYAGGGGGGATARDSGDLRLCKIGKGGLGGGGDSAGGNSNSIPDKYAEYRGTLQLAKPGTDGLGGGGGGNCYASGVDNWVSTPGAKGGSGTVILLFSPVRKLSDASLSKGKVTLTLGDAAMANEYLYCAYGTTDGGESIGAWDKVFAITNLADFAKGTYTFAIPVEVGGDDYPFARIFIAGQDSSFAGFKAEQEVVQVAEYATLNGTQFVNTRRLFGGLEDLEIKVMPTEKTQTERTIFWSRYAPSGNYTRALFWWASNNGLRYDYKTKTDNNGTTCSFTDWQKDEEYVFRTEGPQYFVNGDQVMRKNPTYDPQTDFAGAPLFLFAQGSYSSASVTEEVMNKGAKDVPAGGFVGRFYYADILDKDDKVIVHYVGAIDPSDNKKKLYDTLSGTFISPKLTPSEKGAEPMGPEAETEFTSLENFSWNVPRVTVSVTSALRQNSATVLLIR